MLRHRTAFVLLSLVALVAFAACGGHDADNGHAESDMTPVVEPAPAPAATATATLTGREGSGITGTITFTEAGAGVAYEAHVSGLAAAGSHGFHIHEVGDCSAPDFTSAGGHFNPTAMVHGGPMDSEHHAGDLGNIEIDDSGHGALSGNSTMLTIGAGANSVIGRGVILHEGTDDLVSQPTGDAGGRLACGVVQAGS